MTVGSNANNIVGGVVSAAAPSWPDRTAQNISLDTAGNVRVNLAAGNGSGNTPFSAIVPNNTTAVPVKVAPGILSWLLPENTSANILYMKIYDATSATVGVGAPALRIPIPASTSGTGLVATHLDAIFLVGIVYIVTTGILDSDTGVPAANVCTINMGFR